MGWRSPKTSHSDRGVPGPEGWQNFLELQKELVNTEDRIQAARRFYNGNVRDYRIKFNSFPSKIIAHLFHFSPCDFFDVDPLVRAALSF